MQTRYSIERALNLLALSWCSVWIGSYFLLKPRDWSVLLLCQDRKHPAPSLGMSFDAEFCSGQDEVENMFFVLDLWQIGCFVG